MRIKPDQSLLLLVDLQGGLLPAIEEGDAVLRHAAWLVDLAQLLGLPVLATEHCPAKLGATENSLRARLSSSAIVGKTHFSAVTEGVLLMVPDASRQQWIVTGTEAHVCVQQTVLDLLAEGRQVYVVDEAVGSRRPQDKMLALERMRQAGAVIVSREMVAFEWMQHAGHPAFREVLKRFIR